MSNNENTNLNPKKEDINEKSLVNLPFEASSSNAENSIFHDNYKIIQSIGRGRGSMVYHAQTVPGKKFKTIKDVALKVLIGSSKNPLVNQERMKREAVAMLSARSKNIIQLYDFVSTEGHHYLSMEYASFKDLAYQLSKKGTPFDFDLALLMASQILNGLEVIHNAGIIHRDIKPENLLLTGEGQIKVADFGIASIPANQIPLEDAQRGVGTFDYLAPEMLEEGACTFSTDIYAVGVSLFELLTGQTPFKGESVAKSMQNKVSGNLPKLADHLENVPSSLEELVSKAMASNPVNRFQSAAEFREQAIQIRQEIAKTTRKAKKANKKIIVKKQNKPEKKLAEKLTVVASKSQEKSASSLDSFMSDESPKKVMNSYLDSSYQDNKKEISAVENSKQSSDIGLRGKDSQTTGLNLSLLNESYNHSALAKSTLPKEKMGLAGKLYLLKSKAIKGSIIFLGAATLVWLFSSFVLNTSHSSSISSLTPMTIDTKELNKKLSLTKLSSHDIRLNSFFGTNKHLDFKLNNVRNRVSLKFNLPGNPVTEFNKNEFLSSNAHEININGLKLSLKLEEKSKNTLKGTFEDKFSGKTGTFIIS